MWLEPAAMRVGLTSARVGVWVSVYEFGRKLLLVVTFWLTLRISGVGSGHVLRLFGVS